MSVETDTSSPRPETRRIDSRPKVSLWATACGVGGLLSASALLHPALLIVPGATLLLAVFAVGVDRRSMRSAWGIAMIVGALLLAAGFGGAALRSLSEADRLSEAEAKQFVEYWMSRLAAADLATGLFLTEKPSRRPPPGTDLMAYIGQRPQLRHALEIYYEEQVVRLLRLGFKTEYTHEKTVAWNPRSGRATFWYQVDYTDSDAKRRRARVEVVLQYEFGAPGRPSGWWVQKVILPREIEFIENVDQALSKE